MRCQHRRFARQLRGAIHVQWGWNIGFIVSVGLGAAEYIIGRKMYERNVHLPSDVSQRSCTVAIDAERFGNFAFCLVNRSICSRIDDDRWPDRRDELVDVLAGFQIELRPPQCHYRPPLLASNLTKTPGQLSFAARD